jgi:hypothetical protein
MNREYLLARRCKRGPIPMTQYLIHFLDLPPAETVRHRPVPEGGITRPASGACSEVSSKAQDLNDFAASPGHALRFGAVGRTLEERAGALVLEGGQR